MVCRLRRLYGEPIRVARIAAFMAAVEGAVTAGRSSVMRPFGASAIPSSRGDSHASPSYQVPRCASTRRNSSRRSLPRRSASPRQVLTRPRLSIRRPVK